MTISGYTKEQEASMKIEDELREKFANGRPPMDKYAGLHIPYTRENKYVVQDLTEEEKNIPMILTYQAKKPIGEKCIVSRKQFDQNLEKVTQGVFKGLNWDNVFLAGGAVVSCLQTDAKSTSSDLDLFLYGLHSDEEANKKLVHIHEVVTRNQKSRGDIIRTARAVTIVGGLPYRHVQVILRRYSSPAEVLMGFDIDSCCAGYDGSNPYVADRWQRAITKGYNLVNPTRRSRTYESRLMKYAKRGFSVMVPGLDKERVDPKVFDFDRNKQGLARLLYYEYNRIHRPYIGDVFPLSSDYCDCENVSMLLRQDKAQLFSQDPKTRHHRHIFMTGLDAVLHGEANYAPYWCIHCRQKKEIEAGDPDKYVHGPLRWEEGSCVLQDLDHGRLRKLLTGSFQINIDVQWDKGVYLSDGQTVDDLPAEERKTIVVHKTETDVDDLTTATKGLNLGPKPVKIFQRGHIFGSGQQLGGKMPRKQPLLKPTDTFGALDFGGKTPVMARKFGGKTPVMALKAGMASDEIEGISSSEEEEEEEEEDQGPVQPAFSFGSGGSPTPASSKTGSSGFGFGGRSPSKQQSAVPFSGFGFAPPPSDFAPPPTKGDFSFGHSPTKKVSPSPQKDRFSVASGVIKPAAQPSPQAPPVVSGPPKAKPPATAAPTTPVHRCGVCGLMFSSANQLFTHLRQSGHKPGAQEPFPGVAEREEDDIIQASQGLVRLSLLEEETQRAEEEKEKEDQQAAARNAQDALDHAAWLEEERVADAAKQEVQAQQQATQRKDDAEACEFVQLGTKVRTSALKEMHYVLSKAVPSYLKNKIINTLKCHDATYCYQLSNKVTHYITTHLHIFKTAHNMEKDVNLDKAKEKNISIVTLSSLVSAIRAAPPTPATVAPTRTAPGLSIAPPTRPTFATQNVTQGSSPSSFGAWAQSTATPRTPHTPYTPSLTSFSKLSPIMAYKPNSPDLPFFPDQFHIRKSVYMAWTREQSAQNQLYCLELHEGQAKDGKSFFRVYAHLGLAARLAAVTKTGQQCATGTVLLRPCASLKVAQAEMMGLEANKLKKGFQVVEEDRVPLSLGSDKLRQLREQAVFRSISDQLQANYPSLNKEWGGLFSHLMKECCSAVSSVLGMVFTSRGAELAGVVLDPAVVSNLKSHLEGIKAALRSKNALRLPTMSKKFFAVLNLPSMIDRPSPVFNWDLFAKYSEAVMALEILAKVGPHGLSTLHNCVRPVAAATEHWTDSTVGSCAVGDYSFFKFPLSRPLGSQFLPVTPIQALYAIMFGVSAEMFEMKETIAPHYETIDDAVNSLSSLAHGQLLLETPSLSDVQFSSTASIPSSRVAPISLLAFTSSPNFPFPEKEEKAGPVACAQVSDSEAVRLSSDHVELNSVLQRMQSYAKQATSVEEKDKVIGGLLSALATLQSRLSDEVTEVALDLNSLLPE